MIDWSARELSNTDFFENINQSQHPVFIDFWAAWCPPCRMMDPVIEFLAQKFEERMIVRKLNTDLYRRIAQKMNISGIPTYVIFKDGLEVWRSVGALGKKRLIEICNGIVDGSPNLS